jgi:hypothetical protein
VAISCCRDKGPCFGYGELIARRSLNIDNRCYSLANLSGYNIGKDSESRSMLTNLKCDGLVSRFTISELEVWEIIFEN